MIRYLITALMVITLIACKSDKTAEEQTQTRISENIIELTEAQLRNAGIQTGKIEKRGIASLLKVNGTIDVPPQNMVSISVPLGGYLKFTKLLPGMHVRKGESIAIMEDQQYITLQQEYLTAKAKLTFMEEEYRRQEELNKNKASSDKIYQQVKADYIAQKVLVKSLSEKLKLIEINPDHLTEENLSRSISINSPIDGYVSKVNVNIGKYANPSDILFELVNPSDIHLALNIFEKDINKLYIGQKVIAYTNTNPEKKYSCEIIFIGKDLSLDRSAEVHCHFEQYDKILIPGMFMNAEIEVQNDTAFVIESDAIVRFGDKQYVFVQVVNRKYHMKEVKTHNTEGGYTQIRFTDETDIANHLFVIKGAYTLLMQMKNSETE